MNTYTSTTTTDDHIQFDMATGPSDASPEHSHSPHTPTPLPHVNSSPSIFDNQPLLIVEPHQHSPATDDNNGTHWVPPIHPPPVDKRRPDTLDVPFAFSSAYAQPFDWAQQQQMSEGRRWSLCDPQPASAPAASTIFSQRPWTSSSATSPSSMTPVSAASSSSSSSAPQSYSELRHLPSTTADGFHGSSGAHYLASASASSPSSRPSTTSSLSSYASSSHLATPSSGSIDAFFAPSAIGSFKKRDSAFYSIAHNDSTDTIVDGRNSHPSSHHQQHHSLGMAGLGLGNTHPHHQQHQQMPSHHSHGGSFGSSAVDDSNPFFFARELQSLQVQEHQTQSRSQLPRRPSSGHVGNSLHPTLQTALASTSPSDAYHFYDYATPPSTAGSTSFYDTGLAPRPSTGLPTGPNPAVAAYLQQGRRDSMPTLGGSNSSSQPSANLAGIAPGGPSPYSLIVENSDPATKAGRPHLCTHCNETFRRIHDAKRHAYGALGIKNYACMGGCNMTFKRSEGRARHWQREEVAGVGSAITVADFFHMNPALTDSLVGARELNTVPSHSMMIWGGYGCEKRHGLMMNGTMEEDRRLRNKARRDRILMIGARAAAQATKKKDEEDGQHQQHQHQRGSPTSPSQSPEYDGSGGVGPTRTRRTGYAAVSPY